MLRKSISRPTSKFTCKKKVDVQITASYTPYPMERSSVAPVHIIMNLLARDATTAKTFSGIYATFWTIKAFLIGLYTMKKYDFAEFFKPYCTCDKVNAKTRIDVCH